MNDQNLPIEEGFKDIFNNIKNRFTKQPPPSSIIPPAAPSNPNSPTPPPRPQLNNNTPDEDQGLKGIVDTTSEWKDKMGNVIDGYNNFHSKNVIDSRSIVSRAQNSICQFPIYMTQSMQPNEAHLISKAFERIYANFVQTVMSHNPIINDSEVNNLGFLNKFHNNLTESGGYWVERVSDSGNISYPSLLNEFYTPIDEFDAMMQESMYKKVQLNENVLVEFRVVPCTDKDLIAESKLATREPFEGLRYLSENNYDRTNSKSYDEIIPIHRMRQVLDDYNKAHPNDPDKSLDEMLSEIQLGGSTEYTVPGDRANDPPKVIRFDNLNGSPVYYTGDVSLSQKNSTSLDDKALDAPQMLRETDIKKINGMLPYTISVNFRIAKPNGDLDNVRFLIGIKTVLHSINPSDLAEDLREILSGKEKNLQKVRYKTGEITFANYLFNLKGLKADASKHLNSDKRWMNTLKRLGEYESLHGTLLKQPAALLGGNIPAPIGTLILTQSDVLKISDETNIDLSKVNEARRLARALFLIAIAIVDTTGNSMRVLMPDMDTDWDVQSLSSLEIETNKSNNGALVKEIGRMFNK